MEKRAEERKPRAVLLRYHDTAVVEGKPITFLNYAMTEDVSASGLSFRSLKPLAEERRLRLVNLELWDSPREGVVRWCREAASGVYRVGVALA